MMTKEEALNKIIEYCKNGSKTPVSDFCRIPCSVCPFNNDDNCENDIADSLINRLLKAEERQETNLEHFRGTVVFDNANGIVHIHLINEWGKSYSDDKGAIDWLLSPYEEPKPKYKLSKFEYDLLECYHVSELGIKDYWVLDHLHKKGYFKNVPTDVFTEDILDNCEVVDE